MNKISIQILLLFATSTLSAQVILPAYQGAHFSSEFKCPTTIDDIEGNTYNVIKIGSQCWMGENLKTTKYNDNNNILNIVNGASWCTTTSSAYCFYNNISTLGNIYGALYNFYAVATGKLCPTGWHVPSDAEWQTLEIYLGIDSGTANSYGWRGTNQGGLLKEIGTSFWNSPNTGASNSSVFSARGGGKRDIDLLHNSSPFIELKNYAYFWTSTPATGYSYYRKLAFDTQTIGRWQQDKHIGGSVRCVID